MNAPYRIKRSSLVDPERPLRFTFDGKSYAGLHGDTLASALLANGIHLAGRSFKYHRPRGIMSAGPEEANALVGLQRRNGRFDPNCRATMQALFAGLEARSQNRWPNLQFDFGEAFNLASQFLPAGFYYKTFMQPRWAWKHLYEPIIRKTAGLGEPTREPDPDRYTNRYAHCDLLIVGAGPAGLSAAIAAAESGARVIICDEREQFGGSLLHDQSERIDNKTASQWVFDAIGALKNSDNITLLPRTTAFGYYADNFLCLSERLSDHIDTPPPDMPRERLWQVRAKQVVLAAGAIERPLVFLGNDRPGIMLADAGRSYLNHYGVTVGKRVVIATNNDFSYRAAIDLTRAGVDVAALVDTRAAPSGPIVDELRALGVELIVNAALVETKGRLRINRVKISSADQARDFNCDALCTSAGWTPTVHLFSQSGGKLQWNEDLDAYVPGAAKQAVRCAGACAGVFGVQEAIDDGAMKANLALRRLGFSSAAPKQRVENTSAPTIKFENDPPKPSRGKAFVDYQNDVTVKDIELAVREGFVSIEHVKRYTTNGMATDQGKTSNLHGLRIAARAQGKTPPEVGLTTFRPPYTPVTFGAIANTSRDLGFDPVRTTPIHKWALDQGAVFEDVGMWKRARYFPHKGESMDDAVARECAQVRRSAGIFDASTLGKIEVVGPDAAKFLNLIYTNPWTKLGVGRCRYGLMLREDGFIYDDGVIGRIAEDRFHVTTTTSGAPRVLAHMEDYLQTEFPELKVWLTSTTERWAVIALNGPNVRNILQSLVDDIDLDGDRFPHMSIRHGHILGVPTRLFRVSFTGELGYEINVPADAALSVWEAIVAAGQAYDLVYYGTEAMHVLRAEKGYIIVGQDTDGTVTPDDANLGWAIGKKKKDFVGKRSLARPDLIADGRKQLVGVLTENSKTILEEGAQIVDPNAPHRAIGHVTSSYWSAALDRSIALALIENGRKRINTSLRVPMPAEDVPVQVSDPLFYDHEGTRLNA